MRRAVIIMLFAALAGCTTVRKTLGTYKDSADKGVTVGDRGRRGGTTPPNSVAENTDPGDAPRRKKGKKAKPLDLPAGLGGDKEHRAYTGDAPPKLLDIAPR